MNNSEKQLVVDIIARSFDDNPSVNWIIKNDRKRSERIKAIAAYAYNTCKRRNGVYLSSDGAGVALCYRYNDHKTSVPDYLDQLRLAWRVIGFKRIFRILRREQYIKSRRPAQGDYLYFWFFGVSPERRGAGAAAELKDRIFENSVMLNLPIYLETSIEKNRRAYERYGFKVYHIWDNQKLGVKLWFMKREAEQSEKAALPAPAANESKTG